MEPRFGDKNLVSKGVWKKKRQGLEARWRQFCHFETEYTKEFENYVAKLPIVSLIVSGNQEVLHCQRKHSYFYCQIEDEITKY